MSISTLERERPCCGTATMLLCFDKLEDGVASGRLWSSGCEEVRPFHGLDDLLLTMEAMMDEAGEQLSDPRQLEQGKLCTAAVCVYACQHASIQGEARFPGASPESVYFKSELELLRLLHDWLEQRAKGGDTT